MRTHAFAFDTETDLVRHDTPVPLCAVVTICVEGAPARLYSPAAGREEILRLVREGYMPIGHRTTFDMATLGLTPEDFPRGWYDTSIRGVIRGAASNQHESQCSSLAALAKQAGLEMTGKGTTQLSFRGGMAIGDVTPEQAEYACKDALATYLVWLHQGGRARLPGEEWQTLVSWDVAAMQWRGIHLDVQRVRNMLTIAREERLTLRTMLVQAGLIQPRGPKKDPWREEAVDQKQLQSLLEKAGCKERTPAGKLKADGDTLKETGWPVLMRLGEYKDTEKWISLVEAFDVGPVARPFWKPMVASGRISCSGPNLTQVPAMGGLRECVIAGPGNVLVLADFSGLEYACFADVAYRHHGFSDAREYLRAGKDPHCVIAAQLLGCTYEQALLLSGKVKGHEKAKTPDGHRARQWGKNGNYGLLGGMGERRFAEIIGGTVYQAREVIRAWRDAHREAGPHFERIDAAREGWCDCVDPKTGKPTPHPLHRTVLPWSRRERLAHYTEAANFLIQGTGSDVAKNALHRASKAGLPVVGLIHDEIILDVAEADAADAARELKECMDRAGEEVCPSVPWDQQTEVVDRWPSKG